MVAFLVLSTLSLFAVGSVVAPTPAAADTTHTIAGTAAVSATVTLSSSGLGYGTSVTFTADELAGSSVTHNLNTYGSTSFSLLVPACGSFTLHATTSSGAPVYFNTGAFSANAVTASVTGYASSGSGHTSSTLTGSLNYCPTLKLMQGSTTVGTNAFTTSGSKSFSFTDLSCTSYTLQVSGTLLANKAAKFSSSSFTNGTTTTLNASGSATSISGITPSGCVSGFQVTLTSRTSGSNVPNGTTAYIDTIDTIDDASGTTGHLASTTVTSGGSTSTLTYTAPAGTYLECKPYYVSIPTWTFSGVPSNWNSGNPNPWVTPVATYSSGNAPATYTANVIETEYDPNTPDDADGYLPDVPLEVQPPGCTNVSTVSVTMLADNAPNASLTPLSAGPLTIVEHRESDGSFSSHPYADKGAVTVGTCGVQSNQGTATASYTCTAMLDDDTSYDLRIERGLSSWALGYNDTRNGRSLVHLVFNNYAPLGQPPAGADNGTSWDVGSHTFPRTTVAGCLSDDAFANAGNASIATLKAYYGAFPTGTTIPSSLVPLGNTSMTLHRDSPNAVCFVLGYDSDGTNSDDMPRILYDEDSKGAPYTLQVKFSGGSSYSSTPVQIATPPITAAVAEAGNAVADQVVAAMASGKSAAEIAAEITDILNDPSIANPLSIPPDQISPTWSVHLVASVPSGYTIPAFSAHLLYGTSGSTSNSGTLPTYSYAAASATSLDDAFSGTVPAGDKAEVATGTGNSTYQCSSGSSTGYAVAVTTSDTTFKSAICAGVYWDASLNEYAAHISFDLSPTSFTNTVVAKLAMSGVTGFAFTADDSVSISDGVAHPDDDDDGQPDTVPTCTPTVGSDTFVCTDVYLPLSAGAVPSTTTTTFGITLTTGSGNAALTNSGILTVRNLVKQASGTYAGDFQLMTAPGGSTPAAVTVNGITGIAGSVLVESTTDSSGSTASYALTGRDAALTLYRWTGGSFAGDAPAATASGWTQVATGTSSTDYGGLFGASTTFSFAGVRYSDAGTFYRVDADATVGGNTETGSTVFSLPNTGDSISVAVTPAWSVRGTLTLAGYGTGDIPALTVSSVDAGGNTVPGATATLVTGTASGTQTIESIGLVSTDGTTASFSFDPVAAGNLDPAVPAASRMANSAPTACRPNVGEYAVQVTDPAYSTICIPVVPTYAHDDTAHLPDVVDLNDPDNASHASMTFTGRPSASVLAGLSPLSIGDGSLADLQGRDLTNTDAAHGPLVTLSWHGNAANCLFDPNNAGGFASGTGTFTCDPLSFDDPDNTGQAYGINVALWGAYSGLVYSYADPADVVFNSPDASHVDQLAPSVTLPVGTISGTVEASGGGSSTALGRATVTLDVNGTPVAVTRSAADGSFSFADQPAMLDADGDSLYTIDVSYPGLAGVTDVPVSVVPANALDGDAGTDPFTVNPATPGVVSVDVTGYADLTGTVATATGTELTGTATLRSDTGSPETVFADQPFSDGEFDFGTVPAGDYLLDVTSAGHTDTFTLDGFGASTGAVTLRTPRGDVQFALTGPAPASVAYGSVACTAAAATYTCADVPFPEGDATGNSYDLVLAYAGYDLAVPSVHATATAASTPLQLTVGTGEIDVAVNASSSGGAALTSASITLTGPGDGAYTDSSPSSPATFSGVPYAVVTTAGDTVLGSTTYSVDGSWHGLTPQASVTGRQLEQATDHTVAAALAATGGYGTISGAVTAADGTALTSDDVAAVSPTVTLYRGSVAPGNEVTEIAATVDSSGAYSFTGVPYGSYTIEADAGHDGQTFTATVTPTVGSSTVAAADLRLPYGTVTATVTPPTGTSVTSIPVTLSQSSTTLATEHPDADGVVTFPYVAYGSYTLGVADGGTYPAASIGVALSSSGTDPTSPSLALTAHTATVDVTVAGLGGASTDLPSDLDVTLLNADGTTLHAVPKTGGVYEFSGVIFDKTSGSSYTIHADLTDHGDVPSATKSFTIAADTSDASTIDAGTVQLRFGEVTVTVEHTPGIPDTRAPPVVLSNGSLSYTATAPSSTDSTTNTWTYTFSDVPSSLDTYHASVAAVDETTGYPAATSSANATVTDGSSSSLTMSFHVYTTLSLTLKGLSGGAVPAGTTATADISVEGDDLAPDVAATDGAFSVPYAVSGAEYTIDVTATVPTGDTTTATYTFTRTVTAGTAATTPADLQLPYAQATVRVTTPTGVGAAGLTVTFTHLDVHGDVVAADTRTCTTSGSGSSASCTATFLHADASTTYTAAVAAGDDHLAGSTTITVAAGDDAAPDPLPTISLSSRTTTLSGTVDDGDSTPAPLSGGSVELFTVDGTTVTPVDDLDGDPIAESAAAGDFSLPSFVYVVGKTYRLVGTLGANADVTDTIDFTIDGSGMPSTALALHLESGTVTVVVTPLGGVDSPPSEVRLQAGSGTVSTSSSPALDPDTGTWSYTFTHLPLASGYTATIPANGTVSPAASSGSANLGTANGATTLHVGFAVYTSISGTLKSLSDDTALPSGTTVVASIEEHGNAASARSFTVDPTTGAFSIDGLLSGTSYDLTATATIAGEDFTATRSVTAQATETSGDLQLPYATVTVAVQTPPGVGDDGIPVTIDATGDADDTSCTTTSGSCTIAYLHTTSAGVVYTFSVASATDHQAGSVVVTVYPGEHLAGDDAPTITLAPHQADISGTIDDGKATTATGLAGAHARLFLVGLDGDADTQVGSAVPTDALGAYAFDDVTYLAGRDYYVVATLDANAAYVTATSSTFAITGTSKSVPALHLPTGTITVTVTPSGGVATPPDEVDVHRGSDHVYTTSTHDTVDGTWVYTFANLPAGTDYVATVPAKAGAYPAATSASVDLPAGGSKSLSLAFPVYRTIAGTLKGLGADPLPAGTTVTASIEPSGHPEDAVAVTIDPTDPTFSIPGLLTDTAYLLKATATIDGVDFDASTTVAIGTGTDGDLQLPFGAIAVTLPATAGATASVSDGTTTYTGTTSGGITTFGVLPDGTYTVKVTATDHETTTVSNVVVTAGHTTSVTGVGDLSHLTTSVAGRVDGMGTGLEDGRSGTVELTVYSGATHDADHLVYTADPASVDDTDATFSFAGVPYTTTATPYEYVLTATVDGFTATASGTLSTSGDPIGGKNLQLPYGAVAVVLPATPGVTAELSDGSHTYTGSVDDGVATFTLVPSGSYSLTLSATDYHSATTTDVTVTDGHVTNVSPDALAHVSTSISGQVDGLGAGLADGQSGTVTLKVYTGSTHDADHLATTAMTAGVDGDTATFSFTGVPYTTTATPYEYVLTATVDGFTATASGTLSTTGTAVDDEILQLPYGAVAVTLPSTPGVTAKIGSLTGTAVTDDDVTIVTFDGLAADPTHVYTVTLSAPHYASTDTTVTVTAGLTNPISPAALTHLTTTISGTVTGVGGALPAGGVTITFSPSIGSVSSVTADSNGDFSIEGASSGTTYTVTARGTTHASIAHTESVLASDDATTDAGDIALVWGSISATVNAPSWVAAAGIDVDLTLAGDTVDTQATDASGAVTFDYLPYGTYSLEVAATGDYPAASLPETLSASGTSPDAAPTITLHGHTATVKSTVLGLDGATTGLPSDLAVTLSDGTHTYTGTATAGSYVFSHVPFNTDDAVSYTLSATSAAHPVADVSHTVTIPTDTADDDVVDAGDLQLAYGAVAVTLPSADVTASIADHTGTTSGGVTTFTWLPAGTYSVTLTQTDHVGHTVTGVTVTNGATTAITPDALDHVTTTVSGQVDGLGAGLASGQTGTVTLKVYDGSTHTAAHKVAAPPAATVTHATSTFSFTVPYTTAATPYEYVLTATVGDFTANASGTLGSSGVSDAALQLPYGTIDVTLPDVPGVAATISGHTADADSPAGHAVFSYLPADVTSGTGYTVAVSADHYGTVTRTLTLAAGHTSTVTDVTALTHLTTTLSGTVTHTGGTLPASGVVVTVSPAIGSTTSVTVGADGSYSIPGASSGTSYTLTASLSGHTGITTSATVTAGDSATTVPSIALGWGSVKVTALTGDGDAISSPRLELDSGAVVTADSQPYVFDFVTPGAHTVSLLDGDGTVLSTAAVTVTNGDASSVTVTPNFGSLHLTIATASGTAVTGASAVLTGPAGYAHTATTTASGATFSGLPNGSYSLTVTGGGQTVTTPVSIAGSTRTVALVQRVTTVRGTVYLGNSSDRTALTGALVTLIENGQSHLALTTASGGYSFAGVPYTAVTIGSGATTYQSSVSVTAGWPANASFTGGLVTVTVADDTTSGQDVYISDGHGTGAHLLSGTLRGQVVDNGGHAVDGAEVDLLTRDPNGSGALILSTQYTDQTGTYEFTNVPANPGGVSARVHALAQVRPLAATCQLSGSSVDYSVPAGKYALRISHADYAPTCQTAPVVASGQTASAPAVLTSTAPPPPPPSPSPTPSESPSDSPSPTPTQSPTPSQSPTPTQSPTTTPAQSPTQNPTTAAPPPPPPATYEPPPPITTPEVTPEAVVTTPVATDESTPLPPVVVEPSDTASPQPSPSTTTEADAPYVAPHVEAKINSASTMTVSTPTAMDVIIHDPVKLVFAAGAGVIWVLPFVLVMQLLDESIKEYWSHIRGFFARRFPRAAARTGEGSKLRTWLGSGGVSTLAFYIAGTTFISTFVEPRVGLNALTVRFMASMAVSVIVSTVIVQGIVSLALRATLGHKTAFHASPLGLVVVAGGVVMSRALGMTPGLLLGTNLDLESDDELSEADEIRIERLRAFIVLGMAGAAWFGSGFIPTSNLVLLFLHDSTVAIAVASLGNLVVEMLPIPLVPGGLLAKKARKSWIFLMFFTFAGFVTVVLPGAATAMTNGNSHRVLYTVAIVGVLAMAFVVVENIRRARSRRHEHDDQPDDERELVDA